MTFAYHGVAPFVIIIFTIIMHISIRSKRLTPSPPTKATSDSAFATLATPAFCMGAVVIGHQLQKFHGSRYDLICLVTPDVNATWVEVLSQWWRVVRVPDYKPYPGFRRSWAKLHLWDRTEYKKVVYMDADMLILGSLDELFEYPMLSCVSDPLPPQICNTGVLVIEPRFGLMEQMKRTVKSEQLFQGIGDQGFINAFFKGFTPLPPKYNTPRTQTLGLGQFLKMNETRIVHLVCKKPWKCGREGTSYCGCGYPSLNVLWWAIWDEACEGHICMETWKEGI
jgi:glycogenin glucosyltransferase